MAVPTDKEGDIIRTGASGNGAVDDLPNLAADVIECDLAIGNRDHHVAGFVLGSLDAIDKGASGGWWSYRPRASLCSVGADAIDVGSRPQPFAIEKWGGRGGGGADNVCVANCELRIAGGFHFDPQFL